MVDGYDIPVEQSILGCALIDGKTVPRILSEVGPEDFSDQNRPWALAILTLFRAGETVDPLTVVAEVSRTQTGQDKGQLRQYAMELMEVTPTTANLGVYLGLLESATRLRKLHAAARAILDSPDESGMADLVDGMVAVLGDHRREDVEDMDTGWDRFVLRHNTPVAPDFVPTSLPKLDDRVHIKAGQFVILGGYPSDGKTALALQMALEMGKAHRVGFFSLETDNDTLMDRIAANTTGLSYSAILSNRLRGPEWAIVANAAESTRVRNVDRIRASGYSVTDIRGRTRAKGYQVIFIDYLQLLRGDNSRASRYDQITQISMDLHNLAQQEDVVVIALSQLTRPAPNKSGEIPPPSMHSLRESGQIEQDADVILLLSESKLSEMERVRGARIPDGAELRLLQVAKNKNGKRNGGIHLLLYGDTQRFTQLRLPSAPPTVSREEEPEQTKMGGT
ncbi:MAG: AAA family ATPase [Clostridiales bacterium]|nr:AAA family ATPase [Clostridiales bacterium]